jgi:hypothetical protein
MYPGYPTRGGMSTALDVPSVLRIRLSLIAHGRIETGFRFVEQGS